MKNDSLIEEIKDEVQEIKIAAEEQLQAFEENSNEANRRLVQDARQKLGKMVAETSKWLKENTDRDKVTENIEKLRCDVMQLLNITKEKAIEISQNDEFRSTLRNGKEFLLGSGRLIAGGMRAGADKLMENEKIASIVNRVSDKVEDIKEDERVQEGAQRLKDGTMNLADRAYDGLKHLLEKDDTDK